MPVITIPARRLVVQVQRQDDVQQKDSNIVLPFVIQKAKETAGKIVGNKIESGQDIPIAAGVYSAGVSLQLADKLLPIRRPPTAIPLPPTPQGIPTGLSVPANLATPVTTQPLTLRQVLAATQPRRELGPLKGQAAGGPLRPGEFNPGRFASGPRSAIPVAERVPNAVRVPDLPQGMPNVDAPGRLDKVGRVLKDHAYLITLGEEKDTDRRAEKYLFALVTGGPKKAAISIVTQGVYGLFRTLDIFQPPKPDIGDVEAAVATAFALNILAEQYRRSRDLHDIHARWLEFHPLDSVDEMMNANPHDC